MSNRVSILIAIAVVVVVGLGAIVYSSVNNAVPSGSPSPSSVAAVNNAILTTKTNSTLGEYLTDPSGKALYTFGGDKSGVSNCSGTCLATWPAYVDTGATTGLPSGLGTIARSDNGKVQFTYQGMPLYTFVGDILGHITGNGVSDFHIAKPVAAAANSSTPTPATSAGGAAW